MVYALMLSRRLKWVFNYGAEIFDLFKAVLLSRAESTLKRLLLPVRQLALKTLLQWIPDFTGRTTYFLGSGLKTAKKVFGWTINCNSSLPLPVGRI